MKILLLLPLFVLACSAKALNDRPSYILEILREKTLADDLREIKALIPKKQVESLVRRYLMNDADFQAIARYLGSRDVAVALAVMRGQPEIRGLNVWLKQQLPAQSIDSDDDDDDSSEDLLKLFNRLPAGRERPLRASAGLTGLIGELNAIIPRQEIKNLIRDKVAANGVFAEFWSKIRALQPVYERILKMQEVRRVLNRLALVGVDLNQIDILIRDALDWSAPAPAPPAAGEKPTQKPPAIEGGATQKPPATGGSPTQKPPAIEGGPTQKPPAVEGGPTQKPPAIESGPSQKPPAIEGGPTQKPPAIEGGPTQKRPAIEGNLTQKSPALQGRPTQRPSAIEEGPAQAPPAKKLEGPAQAPPAKKLEGPAKAQPARNLEGPEISVRPAPIKPIV